jgi:hypothetical protein
LVTSLQLNVASSMKPLPPMPSFGDKEDADTIIDDTRNEPATFPACSQQSFQFVGLVNSNMLSENATIESHEQAVQTLPDLASRCSIRAPPHCECSVPGTWTWTWNEENKQELIRAPPHCGARVPCEKERDKDKIKTKQNRKLIRTAILLCASCVRGEVVGTLLNSKSSLHMMERPSPLVLSRLQHFESYHIY